MKILCIGDLWLGSTALQRINTIHEIYGCDQIDSTVRLQSRTLKYLNWALEKLGLHPDFNNVNKNILLKITQKNYDVIWVEKGLRIYPWTLKKIRTAQPDCKIISSSPDDMFNPLNQSKWYIKSIPLFDLHITTKSYNVDELKQLGARDVLFVDKAYDPKVHRIIRLTEEEQLKFGCDVGFIGSWERDRFDHILYLAQQGIKVVVRGVTWKKYKHTHPNLIVVSQNEWADEYAKVINGTKINLCFLKKLNRDLQTARSIEIPACGGFMIAERTVEHQKLFVENREAVFFSNREELLQQVKYYLTHENEREEIARNGYLKCIEAGYSNANMLKKIFSYLLKVNHAKGQVAYQG
ncbi:MAG TPA: glycosyltransferase [Saprospiraceae bacterium]|nr:glycosyltransferase [Saprospiraceae bacterium]